VLFSMRQRHNGHRGRTGRQCLRWRAPSGRESPPLPPPLRCADSWQPEKRVTGDKDRHRLLELGGPPAQVPDLGQERPGQLGSNAGLAIERAFDRPELAPLTSWATVRP
jgi:hypothetical protein